MSKANKNKLALRKLKRTLRVRTSLKRSQTVEEKRYSRELAKAIGLAVRKWQGIYELPDWAIFAYEVVGDIPNHPNATATIKVYSPANEVYIHYRSTLRPEAVDRIIAHELGHWVIIGLWDFLADVLKGGDRKAARRMMEHLVETYTIALVNPDRGQPFNPEIEEEVI